MLWRRSARWWRRQLLWSVAKGCHLSLSVPEERAQHCGRETCFSTDIFSGLAIFASLTSACGCFSCFFSFCVRNTDKSECLPHLSLGPSCTPCAAVPYALLGECCGQLWCEGKGLPRDGARRGSRLGSVGTPLRVTRQCEAPKVSASFWYKHLLMSCSLEQRGDVSAAGRLQRGCVGETAGTSNCRFSQSCLKMCLEPFSAFLPLMALVASSRLPWPGRRGQWRRKKAKHT